jgi:transcriptional regulator with XRE-family HTH domain
LTTTKPTTPDHMTGAELQTLREAAGLSREALAELAQVQARTVKHWETRGGAGVPADVAAMVRAAADWVRMTARQALRDVLQQIHGGPTAAAIASAWAGIFDAASDAPQVVLIRYRETAHMHTQDRAQGLLADVHGAMVARLVLDLIDNGARPRVVWFDPESFARWVVDVQGLPPGHDTPAARTAWSAQVIEAQARPHPADQPPASHTPRA